MRVHSRFKASGRIELTIRNLYDGLPVRRVAPCDGLEVRRTGKFISAARLRTGAEIIVVADAASVGSDAGSIRHEGTLIGVPGLSTSPPPRTSFVVEPKFRRRFATQIANRKTRIAGNTKGGRATGKLANRSRPSKDEHQ